MRILDLFCGAGGAGMGYHRAGFEVVGVDISKQPDYPFKFAHADATALVKDRIEGCWHEGAGTSLSGRWDGCLGHFDVIHMSPPCQGYTALTTGTNAGSTAQPKLVAQMREWADATGLPYVIENVQGSDVRRDLVLCGEMFGLGVIRHRYFEVSGFEAKAPTHKPHQGRVRGWRHGEYFDGPYLAVYGEGGGKGTVAEWQDAMGIHWTDNRHSIAEAIPPAYTEFIGRQLIAHIEAA